MMFRVVVLAEPVGEAVGLAAVEATGGFAAKDVDPERHPVVPGSKRTKKPGDMPGFGMFWLPGTDSNCRPSG
jgi:hypothetical protein